MSTLCYSADIACVNSDYLNRWKIPGVIQVISNPFSIIWCNMWICRLGIIYSSYMLVLHTFSSCSSGILEQPVSAAMDSSKWTSGMACSFLWLQSQNSFISVDICSLLFVLQKSVTIRTCKNKHWVDSKRFVRHLEISSESSSHCSEGRRAIFSSRWTVRLFVFVLRCIFTVCKFCRVFPSLRTAWKVMIT